MKRNYDKILDFITEFWKFYPNIVIPSGHSTADTLRWTIFDIYILLYEDYFYLQNKRILYVIILVTLILGFIYTRILPEK